MHGRLFINKQHLSLHDFTPEEIEKMEGKAIHRDVFKEVKRFDIVTVEDGHLICAKNNVVCKFRMEELDELGMKFPNYKAVIPEIDKTEKLSEIELSLVLLEKARKITMGAESGVRFRFYGASKAVLLRGTNLLWSEEIIILMPKMMKD